MSKKNDKKFDELIKQTRKINEKLNILINIAKRSAPKAEATTEETKILDLCNLKNTIPDMVAKTGKTNSNIRFLLTTLRSKGLIKSEKRDGKAVYSRN